MRRVFVGLAQVFVGLAAQLRNNRLLRISFCTLCLTKLKGRVSTVVSRVYTTVDFESNSNHRKACRVRFIQAA